MWAGAVHWAMPGIALRNAADGTTSERTSEQSWVAKANSPLRKLPRTVGALRMRFAMPEKPKT